MIVAPVNLKLSAKLKAKPGARVLLYFPDVRVLPSAGRQLADGLFSLSYAEFEELTLEFPEDVGAFQFLIVAKVDNKDEWVAGVHFDGARFMFGPFLSALWQPSGRAVEVSVFVLEDGADCMFEVMGVPRGARLSHGVLIEEDVWQLSAREAAKFKVEFPVSATAKKFTLGIVAQNLRRPELASHFNLIVNLEPAPKTFMRAYKEVVVDVGAILAEIAPKRRRHVLSVGATGVGWCVHEGVRLGGKWMVDPSAKKLTFRIYDTTQARFFVRLHFIIELKGGEHVSATRGVEVNLADIALKTRDYSKCIGCKSRRACPMFGSFMDYTGHKSVLRQII